MKNIRFEFKITVAYLLVGCGWILFSDRVLSSMIHDITALSHIQTYKGWFYVIVTSVLFFLFMKNHLSKLRETETELEKHRTHLVMLVQEKTNDLEVLNDELKHANRELSEKNGIIVDQNNELRLALDRLKETQAHLIQSEKMASLGILTAGVAHEINNPLNFIMGAYVGLTHHYQNKSFSENDEQVGILINALKTGVERSVAIIEGLNQFSRTSKSYDEVCDLHEIISNALNMLQTKIQHGITVGKHFYPSDIIIRGNVGNLHQVFVNVLGNAIDAIRGEGTISITTRLSESDAVIEIADTGEGIEPENVKRVTDPFFTTKDPGKGTGLGLSIAYNIIKEHKGQLTIHSEISRGTVVHIALPKK